MTSRAPRWRVVAAALALLVIGGAAGMTLDRFHHRQPRIVEFRQLSTEQRLEALERELPLRPGQRERIATIMHSRQPAIDLAWRDARARIEATVDSVVAEIDAVLDPDQRARYRALVDEVHGRTQRGGH